MNEPRIDTDTPDRGIVPAETAARREREGENFKHIPETDNDQGIDTMGGMTVDKEGLLNNYAIEPEMYYEEPGDARAKEEELAAERAEEMREVNEDKQGELTMEEDKRGKGQGMI
jgi:hypothetical protein